jgi:hypothetical protein
MKCQSAPFRRFLSTLLGGAFLGGCQEGEVPPTPLFPERKWERTFDNTGKLFGDFDLLGPSSSEIVSVNLWQGALKSLASFPLEIADPEKGLIQTQWIVMDKFPQDRFQIRVLLAPGNTPRVEAVDVSIIHQVLKEGTWVLTSRPYRLERDIKEAILLYTRTRCARKPR